MTTADKKRSEHIVDYLLYVWQMEDAIRAVAFHKPRLMEIAGGPGTEDGEWLVLLAQEMAEEKVTESGHVRSIQEALNELAMLHEMLLGPVDDVAYKEAFETAKPHLHALDKSTGQDGQHPVMAMLTGLYGWLLLRMKKEAISPETNASMAALRNMANALARGHMRIYQV